MCEGIVTTTTTAGCVLTAVFFHVNWIIRFHFGCSSSTCSGRVTLVISGMIYLNQLTFLLPCNHQCQSTEGNTSTHPNQLLGIVSSLFTNRHTRLTSLYPGLPVRAGTNLDFTEARDSEWQWHQLGHMQVCISLQADNHTSTPPLSFLQGGCPSCRPTNSVKALKATLRHLHSQVLCGRGFVLLIFLQTLVLSPRCG